ncbi:hypothetical protein [Kribbella sp. HUAS MG21]|uniref:Uncharacterized protein n=1 Tax=Kribbella sp. HUAS MG21 TaxID=3160966 RepID=A0AAU7THQ4_9ACTN
MSTDNTASPRPWGMWLELGLTLGAMSGARLLTGTVHGAPSYVLGAVASLLLLTFALRAGVWAERVARRKGIYHPQYFVLGPIGLLMALATKPNPQAAVDTNTPPTPPTPHTK